MRMGSIDIAWWTSRASATTPLPLHELLGTYRERLPAYASAHHGDENGGLDSPEAFADFAEESHNRGFDGFEIHGRSGSDVSRKLDREIPAVSAVGARVGDEMDWMLDPARECETFGDALTVGRALDDAGGGRFVVTDDGTFATIDCTVPRKPSSMTFNFVGQRVDST